MVFACAKRTGARLGLPGATQTGSAAASTGSGLTRADAFGMWAAVVESVGAPVAGVRVRGAMSPFGWVTVGRKSIALGTGPIDVSMSVAQSNCCGSCGVTSGIV